MKTSKYILLAVAFVLLASLGTAMAQGNANEKGTAFQLPDPMGGVVKVNAVEVTDGTYGYDGQTKQATAFGYSFLGRTTGNLPGSFSLFMNCTPSKAMPGDKSEMTGGAWTLPVYVEGSTGYAGSLYGTVSKGTMNWDKTGTNGNIFLVLNVDGGTQAWDGVAGYATFTGTLLVDEKTQKTTLTGDLVFYIIGAVTEK